LFRDSATGDLLVRSYDILAIALRRRIHKAISPVYCNTK